ncbi:helix-turn-helix domain-containing protein [Cohnella suwonensis]|uniref:Helix-turn-helix domain-containing protein n=1 Tax=Cohnella suwonensis TaxID=696072 RepID=A0ABW0LSP6_9BACL
MEDIRLNVALLRQRVPHLTSAARSVGLRAATVSNLCTGKIHIGRAEVRTLAALASLAGCTMDDLIIQGGKFEMIETGIKTLDLFAPLTKGGTAGLVARPKMGQLVILAELFFLLRKQGFATALLKPDGRHPEIDDVTEDAEFVCADAEEAFSRLSRIGSTKDVVIAADRSHVTNNEIYRLQDRLREAGVTSLTTLLVDLKGEAVDEELPFGPLETLWQFDADLAVRHVYPAVNAVLSASEILESARADAAHLSVQQKAKRLLRRYKELRFLVQAHGLEALPPQEAQTFIRGELLEAYLTQPLYVAAAFTGKAGTTVALQDALHDVQRILEGAEDHREADQLMYIGQLPH